MAKDLPYFKFFCSEWNDGDITLEDYITQGVFINVCSYYWSNECDVTIEKLNKRFKNNQEELTILFNSDIIKKDEAHVVISFLDEQLAEREERSKQSSIAGKASAKARKEKREANDRSTAVEIPLNGNPTNKRREEERREEERREEERREEPIFPSEVGLCYFNCLEFFPEHLHPKTSKEVNNWQDTIEKLNRIDKIPFESIVDIVKRTRQDSFWSKNFLSLTKLRKKNSDGIMYVVVFNERTKTINNGNNKTRRQKFEDAFEAIRNSE